MTRIEVIFSILLATILATFSYAQLVNVKANVAQFHSTYSFSYFTQSKIVGPVAPNPICVVGTKGYFTTGSAVVEIDLTQSVVNSTNQLYYSKSYGILPTLSAVVRDPQSSNGSRLILVTENPTRLAFINRDKGLSYVQSTIEGYPPTINAFGETSDVITTLTHPTNSTYPRFIIVSSVGAALVEAQTLKYSHKVFPGLRIASGAWDAANKKLYLGFSNGKVYRLNVNETDLDDSAVSQLQLPSKFGNGTAGVISVLQGDWKRGWLYAVSAGANAVTSSVVHRIKTSDFTLDSKRIVNNDVEYSISTGAIDADRGILYLVASTSNPRYIQIDLPDFYKEYSLEFFANNTDVGAIKMSWIDLPRGNIYFGGASKRLGNTQITRYKMADSCKENCYSRGTCNYRHCTCGNFTSLLFPPNKLPYTQPWCLGKSCDQNCSSTISVFHGVCSENGTCNCGDIWTGDICETAQCPRNCSGHGVCKYDVNQVPLNCSCSEGFQGEACNLAAVLPCQRYKSCDACMLNPACGWCADSNTCAYGNDVGPSQLGVGCRNWHFQECNTITEIINYVFIGIMALLITWNLFSLVLEYTAGEPPSRRTSWYRYQRSGKSWSLFYQFQLIGSLIFLGGKLPSVFVSFVRVWNWTNFGIGLPFSQQPTVVAPIGSRALLNVGQYLTYASTPDTWILSGILFWFVVIVGIAYVLFFISIVIAVIRSANISDIIKQYPLYIIFHALDIGYFPIVLGSAVQIANTSNGGYIAQGIIFLVAVGIGYPLLVFFLIRHVGKKLYLDENKVKYFPLHGHAPPKNLNWATFPLIRRFLVACIIGFLTSVTLVAQLAVVIVIQIAWIFTVGFKGDVIYGDYLQRRIEIFLALVNVLSLGVIIAFIANIGGLGITGVTIAFIVIQFIGIMATIAFYITEWLQAVEVYSCAQFGKCITCKDDYGNEEEMK